jgi:hypothetical protein
MAHGDGMLDAMLLQRLAVHTLWDELARCGGKSAAFGRDDVRLEFEKSRQE